MEPLTIIGAGPVGSLLATHLARRGCDVTLYESRAERGKKRQSRAYRLFHYTWICIFFER